MGASFIDSCKPSQLNYLLLVWWSLSFCWKIMITSPFGGILKHNEQTKNLFKQGEPAGIIRSVYWLSFSYCFTLRQWRSDKLRAMKSSACRIMSFKWEDYTKLVSAENDTPLKLWFQLLQWQKWPSSIRENVQDHRKCCPPFLFLSDTALCSPKWDSWVVVGSFPND